VGVEYAKMNVTFQASNLQGTYAENARARADEDNGDRAKAEAKRGCGVSAGIKAGRDAGRRSREEEGVKRALEERYPRHIQRDVVLRHRSLSLRSIGSRQCSTSFKSPRFDSSLTLSTVSD
jgi:hypothetical protein